METIENPNIFDIESVTVEHQKNLLQNIRSIKQPKSITEQSNKIYNIRIHFIQNQKQLIVCNNYVLIKDISFPKKYFQRNETKILNAENYDEQLNVTRSSIKRI